MALEQVGAIMSGLQHGLTMVVGPPGTGKTDTAVQIMHVLYHNQPEQRTLLITHSNQVSGCAKCILLRRQRAKVAWNFDLAGFGSAQ